MQDLALITQYMFLITMLGMAAGSAFFWFERDTLAPEFRSAATIARIYTAIAAFMYWRMSGMVGTDANPASMVASPTHYRYVDWAITTPLMLVSLMVLLQIADEKRGIAFVLIAADVAMIIFGYFGEIYSHVPGMEFQAWVMFGLGSLAFLILLYMMYSARRCGERQGRAGKESLPEHAHLHRDRLDDLSDRLHRRYARPG